MPAFAVPLLALEVKVQTVVRGCDCVTVWTYATPPNPDQPPDSQVNPALGALVVIVVVAGVLGYLWWKWKSRRLDRED
jgi:hypothetical protein